MSVESETGVTAKTGMLWARRGRWRSVMRESEISPFSPLFRDP